MITFLMFYATDREAKVLLWFYRATINTANNDIISEIISEAQLVIRDIINVAACFFFLS